jgi:hypothetical protein
MPWSGWPTTLVSQLTFTEWQFALRPRREILAGYTLSYLGAWHVFGDDRWVWFNGVIPGNRGAVEIVTQWAEAENLGPTHRHWRWVHWRNPSNETVYVTPRFLLAPPLEDRDLRVVESSSRTKRIWTIADVASNEFSGTGLFIPPDDDDEPGGGGAGGGTGGRGGREARPAVRHERRGVVPGMALRTLEGQRLTAIELIGDERFLPIEEIDARLERLVDPDKYRK